MDTRQIDNFMTVYACRNARRAADLLFITQQGLSRSIQ
jgi:DNA-binding transcriptional LysR family regulator